MKDDFDSGMGIPDDELAGGSATEGDALGGHDGDVELDVPESEPVGRASGGARAMQSSGGAGKPAPRKAAPAKKKAAKKAAKPAKKAAKASKKSAPKKKSAKKAAPKKKAAKRKAGKKK